MRNVFWKDLLKRYLNLIGMEKSHYFNRIGIIQRAYVSLLTFRIDGDRETRLSGTRAVVCFILIIFFSELALAKEKSRDKNAQSICFRSVKDHCRGQQDEQRVLCRKEFRKLKREECSLHGQEMKLASVCAADVKTLCSGLRERRAIRSCLVQKKSSVTQECQKFVGEKIERKKKKKVRGRS
ncbi:hypothetical protein D3C87_1216250 [compost metagenome]